MKNGVFEVEMTKSKYNLIKITVKLHFNYHLFMLENDMLAQNNLWNLANFVSCQGTEHFDLWGDMEYHPVSLTILNQLSETFFYSSLQCLNLLQITCNYRDDFSAKVFLSWTKSIMKSQLCFYCDPKTLAQKSWSILFN